MGALCTPRTAVLIPTEATPGRRLPLRSGQSLHPADIPPTGISLNEASTRVQAIRPSGLPLACGRPDGTGRPWALPRASHPADQEPTTHAEGGDRPSSTDLELPLNSHSVDLQSGSSLITCDFASHVPTRSSDVRAGWRVLRREAVGISVLSGGFKTLLGWLENSLGLTVVSCC